MLGKVSFQKLFDDDVSEEQGPRVVTVVLEVTHRTGVSIGGLDPEMDPFFPVHHVLQCTSQGSVMPDTFTVAFIGFSHNEVGEDLLASTSPLIMPP